MSSIAPSLLAVFQRISARSRSSSSLVIHGMSAPVLAAVGSDVLLYITGLCVADRELSVRVRPASLVLVVSRRSGVPSLRSWAPVTTDGWIQYVFELSAAVTGLDSSPAAPV